MTHPNRSQKSVPTGRRAPFLVYLAASVVIFFLALSAADSIGFVPCQIDDTCSSAMTLDDTQLTDANMQNNMSPTTVTDNSSSTGIPPTHIKIATIDLDLPVQNPTTTDLSALDVLLQKGPARHALSGLLGDDRNMIIFGHSSHLPIVHNQMYKAFNRIPELKAGDSVELDGENGVTYLYSVSSVEKADATNFDENFLGTPGKKLIIVTCDTLTSKSARFVVKADFVGIVGQ